MLAALADAQPTLPRTLIGFSSATAALPVIMRQRLCAPGDRVCPTGVPAPSQPWGGGAAYNSLNSSLWHTQGTRMAETRIGDCELLCSVAANLTLGAGSLCTGLEICESQYAMFALESVPGAAALTRWHIRGCPPVVLSTCRFSLPTPNHIAGAVAIDEERGLILYAASIWNTAVPQNFVLVARLSAPCDILCRFPVQTCGRTGLVALSAMTYDACARRLYISDGSQTVVYQPSNLGPCDWREVDCCANSPNVGSYVWHGFDVEPAHPRGVGTSCTGPNCPSCPNMLLRAEGDPTVGNPGFALALSDAPSPSVLVTALSFGPCLVPGFPIFCGSWHTDLGQPTVWLPSIGMAGPVGCQGSARLPLAIPYDYSICGTRVCAQGVVVCRNVTVFGVALTNAVDFTVD
jgi:hypothetical protein